MASQHRRRGREGDGVEPHGIQILVMAILSMLTWFA
jgi:hypothetical protein